MKVSQQVAGGGWVWYIVRIREACTSHEVTSLCLLLPDGRAWRECDLRSHHCIIYDEINGGMADGGRCLIRRQAIICYDTAGFGCGTSSLSSIVSVFCFCLLCFCDGGCDGWFGEDDVMLDLLLPRVIMMDGSRKIQKVSFVCPCAPRHPLLPPKIRHQSKSNLLHNDNETTNHKIRRRRILSYA
jgi:hypothetical protein